VSSAASALPRPVTHESMSMDEGGRGSSLLRTCRAPAFPGHTAFAPGGRGPPGGCGRRGGRHQGRAARRDQRRARVAWTAPVITPGVTAGRCHRPDGTGGIDPGGHADGLSPGPSIILRTRHGGGGGEPAHSGTCIGRLFGEGATGSAPGGGNRPMEAHAPSGSTATAAAVSPSAWVPTRGLRPHDWPRGLPIGLRVGPGPMGAGGCRGSRRRGRGRPHAGAPPAPLHAW
jgi:hypothetical protein